MRITTRLNLALTSTAIVALLSFSPAYAQDVVLCDPAIPGWSDNPETEVNECNSLNTLAPAAGDEGGDEEAAPEEEADQPDELNDPEPPTEDPPAEEPPAEEPPAEEPPAEEPPAEEPPFDECDGECEEKEEPVEFTPGSESSIDLPTKDAIVLG
jgi:hypothetical protein